LREFTHERKIDGSFKEPIDQLPVRANFGEIIINGKGNGTTRDFRPGP